MRMPEAKRWSYTMFQSSQKPHAYVANQFGSNELVFDVLTDAANGLPSHLWEEAQASDVALDTARAEE